MPSLAPPPVRVATAGEALIDLVDNGEGLFTPAIGGAVLNVARALARQGIGSAYLNPLSSDRFGRMIRAALQADGVQPGSARPVREPTSLAVVSLDAAGHPDYAFYRSGVADRAIDANTLVARCEELDAIEVVCTGALALAPEDSDIYLAWLRAQKKAGRFVVVDANLRPAAMPDLAAYRTNVLAALALADLVKVSDEDLVHLGIAGADPLEQALHLLETSSPQLMALTLGREGAFLILPGSSSPTRSKAIDIHRGRDPAALAVVDTIGAGDSFLAGLLASMIVDRDAHASTGDGGPVAATHVPSLAAAIAVRAPQRATHWLSHALASASHCVERKGCQPPSWEEAQARTHRIAGH